LPVDGVPYKILTWKVTAVLPVVMRHLSVFHAWLETEVYTLAIFV
jgi:hypothetical protein